MKTCTYVFLSKKMFKFLLSSLSPGWKIVPKRWTNVTDAAWTSLLDFLVRETFVLKNCFLQSLPWLEWNKSRYSLKKNSVVSWPHSHRLSLTLHSNNCIWCWHWRQWCNSCKNLTFSIQMYINVFFFFFFLTVWVHVGKASLWEKDQSSYKGNKWVMSCYLVNLHTGK